MFRSTAVAAALALVALVAVGCGPNRGGGGGGGPQDTTGLPDTPTELAAYAGNARYPNVQAAQGLLVASIVSNDKRSIKLYNFSTENIRDVDVWVNGSFVKRIGGIAPQSSVTISTNELYNGLGHTLYSRGEEVSRVELQSTPTQLFNLLGPATE